VVTIGTVSYCLSVCLRHCTKHVAISNDAVAMAMYFFFFVRLVVAVAREATCLEGVCTGTGGWGGLECSSQGVTILLVLSVAYSPLHTTCRNGGILDMVCAVRSTALFFSPLLSKKVRGVLEVVPSTKLGPVPRRQRN
jgi:hypothetical protein